MAPFNVVIVAENENARGISYVRFSASKKMINRDL